jgi:hypothetical protein
VTSNEGSLVIPFKLMMCKVIGCDWIDNERIIQLEKLAVYLLPK